MTVTGSVADNAAGQGLSENSVKLLIQRKSDNTYWDGTSWGGSAAQLSTTHPATVAGEAVDWTTNIPESIWSDGNYTCVVLAADRAGNISSQNEISFLYDATPPAVPENIVALAGNTSISLTWRNPADSDFRHVLLYRSEQSDFSPGDATKIAETESSDVATYMDTGVSNNVTYYYKMQAVDDIGNTSAASMQASARPDSDNPTTPGSPSLSVKIDTIDNVEYTSSKNVEFVFAPSTDENSGIKQYLVTIGTVSGGSDILDRTSISSTKYPHTFNNDGSYFVRVMAEDQLGNTSSESRELAIIVDSTAPAVPTETLMYDASDRANEIFAVAFSFVVPDDLSGILGYVVAKNGSDILDHSNGLMTDGVSINEKTGKGTYLVVAESDKSDSYTIRAIDKAHNSSVGQVFSSAGTATVDSTGQQVGGAKITLVSSVVGEGKLEISAVEANPSTVVGEQTQATVIWRSTVPSTTKVEYGLTENYEFATKLDEGLNSYHTAILSELTPDTTYHYRVISTDKYGNSTASDDATFTTNAQQKEESVFEKIIQSITLTFSTIYNQVSSAIRQLL